MRIDADTGVRARGLTTKLDELEVGAGTPMLDEEVGLDPECEASKHISSTDSRIVIFKRSKKSIAFVPGSSTPARDDIAYSMNISSQPSE